MSAALEITEKDWDAQLFNSHKGLAPSLGWKLSYHTLRSKGSQPGFPDRTCVRERLLFAELKTEKGKPTERQVVWLDALSKAGAEVYLWRPSDLEEIGRILSGRWRFMCYRHAESVGEVQPPHLATISGPWSPASIWFPGQGRWGDTPWA